MSQRATLGALAVVAIALVIAGIIFHMRDAAGLDRAHSHLIIKANPSINPPCELVNKAAAQMSARKGDTLTWSIVGNCDNVSITVTSNLLQPVVPVPATNGQNLMAGTPPDAVGDFGFDVTFGNQIAPSPAARDANASPQPPPPPPPPASPSTAPICQKCVIVMCKDWPCF